MEFGMPPRNVLVLFTATVVSMLCYERAVRNRYAASVSSAMNLVTERYVSEVDSSDLFEGAMSGMMNRLDPNSSYAPPSDFQRLEEDLDQQFGGIGIIVEPDAGTERLRVTMPMVGTPAFEAGIRPRDIILSIDGRDTKGIQMDEALKSMRGAPGSAVAVRIEREGETEPIHFTLTRAEIAVESVTGERRLPNYEWEYRLFDDPRFAYVRIRTFGEKTASEFESILKKVIGTTGNPAPDPVSGIVIDLRGNPGGLLTAAVEVCDLFLHKGEVVSTRGRGGKVERQYSASPGVACPDNVPIVVLLDRFSASASEIVAACLQDHGRAKVVGQRSWGKGTVQNVFPLEGSRGAIRLTTASYWRPSGKNIHKFRGATDEEDWGVRPEPGLEIALSDDEVRQMLRARNDREYEIFKNRKLETRLDESQIVPSDRDTTGGEIQPTEDSPPMEPNVTPPVPSVEENPLSHREQGPSENAKPFRDLQLEKAVEVLRAAVDSNPSTLLK